MPQNLTTVRVVKEKGQRILGPTFLLVSKVLQRICLSLSQSFCGLFGYYLLGKKERKKPLTFIIGTLHKTNLHYTFAGSGFQ